MTILVATATRPSTLLDTRRPRLLLVAFCLALWLPGFVSIPPGDRDESRFAQATRQMLETGDYVRIMNGTEPRNRKPIGIHWLQAPFAAAARHAGLATANPIWPYRLPSLLGGLVAVLACFEAGACLLDRRTALLAAGMLAASVVLVTEVHIAKTDAALLGATTVAMALLGRAYLGRVPLSPAAAAGFWLAMGVGILLKGPIAPMVAGLAVVALLVADRGRPGRATWLRALRPGWGIPLMLLVVLPWFVAIGVATGGRFFADAVGGDLGRKLASGDDSHGGPPGLHLLLVPVLLFPATAALPAAAALAWRRRRDPAIRFLLAWILPAWLVFEAAPTKLPHYTLPLYPALALLLALGLTSGARTGRWRWVGAVLAATVALGFAAAAVAAPWLLGTDRWAAAPATLAALLAGTWAVRAHTTHGAMRAGAAAVLLYAALLGWELPRLWPLWIAPRVLDAVPGLSTRGSADPPRLPRLASVGFAEPSLMFLAGTNTRFMLAPEAADALAAGTLDVILVGDRDLAAVQAGLAARGINPRLLAIVPGFNYSRGRRITLTALARP